MNTFQQLAVETYGLPEETIDNSIKIYLFANDMIKRYEEVQTTAKTVISKIMVQVGEFRFETKSGNAMVTAAGFSVKYDTEALDDLAISDPELFAKIKPYRSEVERPGVLRIAAPKDSKDSKK